MLMYCASRGRHVLSEAAYVASPVSPLAPHPTFALYFTLNIVVSHRRGLPIFGKYELASVSLRTASIRSRIEINLICFGI